MSTDDVRGLIDSMEKKAKEGDVATQFSLAAMYLNGDGVPQNLLEGVQWMSIAARSGHKCAQHELALWYINGDLLDKDETQAAYWFEKAAEQGLAEAQYNFGYLLKCGIGVEQDYKKAAYWYQLSLEQDYTHAYVSLGVLYSEGKGVELNLQKAVQLFQIAADSGDIEGLLNLSIHYFQGKGVPVDREKAVRLLESAAFQGDKQALDLLMKYATKFKSVEATRVLAYLVEKKKLEQNAVIVSKDGDGHFESLAQAVKQVPPGSVLLLKPGVFEEKIEIEKSLDIIGDGSRSDIVIKGSNWDFVLKESRIRLKNITFQGGVMADGSTLTIEDCEVFGYHQRGIELDYHSSATITRCKIHDDRGDDGTGVYVGRDSYAEILNSEIFKNSSHGIFVSEGARLNICDSRVHSNWAGIGLTKGSTVNATRCNLLDNDGTSVHNFSNYGEYTPVETLQYINPSL